MAELTILVPLDGSKPAETALSFLKALRPVADMRVRILSVVDSPEPLPVEEERRRLKLLGAYLDGVTERAAAELGVTVEPVGRVGVAYAEILDEASRPDVNMIVMTSHGKTSVEPEHLGSVADKVVRGAMCPVLLVGPHAAVPDRVGTITVPLDASMLAAEALPVAKAFVERLNGRLRLVQAIQPPVSLESDSGSSFTDAILDESENMASLYLSEARLELETQQPVETEVLFGQPWPALHADLKENPPDLVIMTSHGHTGFMRWALGSVTDRMIRGPVPVLILRPVAEASDWLKPLKATASTKGVA